MVSVKWHHSCIREFLTHLSSSPLKNNNPAEVESKDREPYEARGEVTGNQRTSLCVQMCIPVDMHFLAEC